EDRTVLEHAAVIGRQFSRDALAHLLPGERPNLEARLASLRRSELIEPDTGWLFGEPTLRFHHNLMRDAAYRRLLKGTRAELHAQVAGWLEAAAGQAVEHDEAIGWHLEQAHQNLRELGPLDAHGRALGERRAPSRRGGPARPRPRRPVGRREPARSRRRTARRCGPRARRARPRLVRGAARGRGRGPGAEGGRRARAVRRRLRAPARLAHVLP